MKCSFSVDAKITVQIDNRDYVHYQIWVDGHQSAINGLEKPLISAIFLPYTEGDKVRFFKKLAEEKNTLLL